MMKILTAAVVVLAMALSMTGCGGVGKAGPVEQYLRVSGGESPCDQNVAAGQKRAVVGLRPIKASETLDRQAVLLTRGRVMNPSTRWYWEASPVSLFEQALLGALRCSPTLTAAWPVRSTTEAQLMLTCVVTDFEVQEQPLALTASLDCQAWDGDGVRLVAARTFSASVPVTGLAAQAIAEAGAKALSKISGEAKGWLESLAATSGTQGAPGVPAPGGGKK